MELAAQEARPVPTKVSRKQGQSKGAGAKANPAEVVLTTRAATQKQSRARHHAGPDGNGQASPLHVKQSTTTT